MLRRRSKSTQACPWLYEKVGPGDSDWDKVPEAVGRDDGCLSVNDCDDDKRCYNGSPPQQTCRDPNPDPKVRSDFVCICPAPSNISKTGSPANCPAGTVPPTVPTPAPDGGGIDEVQVMGMSAVGAAAVLSCGALGELFLGSALGALCCSCGAAAVKAARKRRPENTPPFTGPTAESVMSEASRMIETLTRLFHSSLHESPVAEWISHLKCPDGVNALNRLQNEIFAREEGMPASWVLPEGPLGDVCLAVRLLLRMYTFEPQDEDAMAGWPGAPTIHKPQPGAAEVWEKYIKDTEAAVGAPSRNPSLYRDVNTLTRAVAEDGDGEKGNAAMSKLAGWAKTVALLLSVNVEPLPGSFASRSGPPGKKVVLLRLLGNLSPELRQKFGRLRTGMFLAWSSAVASTTANRKCSADFLGESVQQAVLFRMTFTGSNCARCVTGASMYPDENEWLIPFGSLWRVTRVHGVRRLASVICPGSGETRIPPRRALEALRHPLLVVDMVFDRGILTWSRPAADLVSAALAEAQRDTKLLDPAKTLQGLLSPAETEATHEQMAGSSVPLLNLRSHSNSMQGRSAPVEMVPPFLALPGTRRMSINDSGLSRNATFEHIPTPRSDGTGGTHDTRGGEHPRSPPPGNRQNVLLRLGSCRHPEDSIPTSLPSPPPVRSRLNRPPVRRQESYEGSGSPRAAAAEGDSTMLLAWGKKESNPDFRRRAGTQSQSSNIARAASMNRRRTQVDNDNRRKRDWGSEHSKIPSGLSPRAAVKRMGVQVLLDDEPVDRAAGSVTPTAADGPPSRRRRQHRQTKSGIGLAASAHSHHSRETATTWLT
eukprot:Hpha_TRINITY_DN16527_c0_g3::TRINITY_DN16527_c0_g3_i2::g.135512::m.135512